MIIASRLAFAIRTSRQAHYIHPTAHRLFAPVARQLSSIGSPVDPLDDEVLQGGRYVLELAKLSKEELLARCSEMGITKCKTKSKAKLVELILNKNIDHNIQRIFNRATSDTDKKSNKKNDKNENDSEGSKPLASSEDKVLPHDKMENEEQLADHWRAMEKRLLWRKTKPKGPNTPEGRGTVRPSAWDHENV